MPRIMKLRLNNQTFSHALLAIRDRCRSHPMHLVIDEDMTPAYLSDLSQWVATLPWGALTKLSLPVNCQLLPTPEFHQLMLALKNKSPDSVELLFQHDELTASSLAIEQHLTNHVATMADFPVVIVNAYHQTRVSFPAFETQIIKTIQGSKKIPTMLDAEADSEEWADAGGDAPLAKRIKLKALIHPDAPLAVDYNQYVQVDMQHMEVLEQGIDEVVEAAVVAEQAITQYHGPLIDYAKFNGQHCREIAKRSVFRDDQIQAAFKLAETELFANLPHAIKYLSPAAAEKLASNLPQWVALNKENLPGFILKKTAQDEYILDYDPFAEQDEEKHFCPHEYTPYDDQLPYYSVESAVAALLPVIKNQAIEARIQQAHHVPLMNLWIKHGEQGVKTFYNRLNQLDEVHPELSNFLDQAYLSHFEHLEPFYHDRFFDGLNKLEQYSPLQINLLKRFLMHTGTSRHDLLKTLENFDYFWREVGLLCEGHPEWLTLLDVNWTTAPGGQPVVYMERLLTVLKNARDVHDQLHCLKELHLDSYGAYYASKYEGFTAVDSFMDFVYQPDKINRIPFNSGFQLYRISLDAVCEMVRHSVVVTERVMNKIDRMWNPVGYETWAIESKEMGILDYESRRLLEEKKAVPFAINYAMNYEELPSSYGLYETRADDRRFFERIDTSLPISAKRLYAFMYRFIGQQLSGIKAHEFFEALQQHWFEVIGQWLGLRTEREKALNISLLLSLQHSLFHITHERYTGVLKDYHNIDSNRADEDSATFKLLLRGSYGNNSDYMDKSYQIVQLKQLYDRNIKFNDLEATYYTEIESNAGFASLLHAKLMTNQYAAFKFINFQYASFKFMNPILRQATIIDSSAYAFHTEDYFAQLPEVADAFRDDLLVFSAISNKHFFYANAQDIWMKLHAIPLDPDMATLQEIRTYLQQAASGLPTSNYLHYAYKLMVSAEQFLNHQTVLSVFKAVSHLALVDGQINAQAVRLIFQEHRIIGIKVTMPTLPQRDNHEINNCLIDLILKLEQIKKHGVATMLADMNQAATSPAEAQRIAAKYNSQEIQQLDAQLRPKNIIELQVILKQLIAESGFMLSMIAPQLLKSTLSNLKITLIQDLFKAEINNSREPNPFMLRWAESTLRLSDLQDDSDFDQIDRSVRKSQAIALVCRAVSKHACVVQQQDAYLALLANVHFNRLDSELVFQWTGMFSAMPQRDHLPILKALLNDATLIYQKEPFLTLISLIAKLNAKQFSTTTIVDFCHRFAAFSADFQADYHLFIEQLTVAYSADNKDRLIHMLLTEPGLTVQQMLRINADTHQMADHRDKLAHLYIKLKAQGQLATFLQQTAPMPFEQKSLIIMMLAKAYASRRTQDPEIDMVEVSTRLAALSIEQLNALSTLYDTTPISISCLGHALINFHADSPFEDFLQGIEKSPFGKRQLKEQFDCSQLERVINGSSDLINKSTYTYHHRKQLMESFLLINEMGYQLPVFNGKPAMALSNLDIKTLFAAIKADPQQDSMKNKLCALTLMREAMYRSTGQFPNSTQMLVLIDCMLHHGHVISNFETGQGKSLVDVMKCAFLWLYSDRVEITTSSIVDAKRDIENYSPFLVSLGVPFAAKPISASSAIGAFCPDGINFSTFAQLSLFYSKAMACGEIITTPNDKVSLVVNESDHSLLEDQTAYRFATTAGVTLGKAHEWVYSAINSYVETPPFTRGDSSMETDIRRLRRYLASQARVLGKSAAIVEKFDDDCLLRWIESAILVKYKLNEDEDYVVVPVPDQPDNYVVKLLMSDKKVSPDSVFGNGCQQLLQARLNSEKRIPIQGHDAFTIDPETKTIISRSNRNLIDDYRAKKGLIWGSSGTVGSEEEIVEQYQKYGFAFSKIEPHHKRQVIEHPLLVLPTKAEHYQHLSKKVIAKRNHASPSPVLIFCQDIEKAREIYAHLLQTTGQNGLQLFIGTGDEEAIIKQAASPGMITVTTSAIGRNTDVPYDKAVGLDVWHTCITSTRQDGQKSGRTGRQGSKGTNDYILNVEDQQVNNLNDIKRLREKLDAVARKKRDFNEGFYVILGHLLAQLERIPSFLFTEMSKQDFLRKQWAPFSVNQEQRYRELVLANQLDRRSFIEEARTGFLQLIANAAPGYDMSQLPPFEESAYAVAEKYNPYTKPVCIADCTPSVVIAHELCLAKQEPVGALAAADKETIQLALKTLFSGLTSSNYMQRNAEFLTFMYTLPASQAEIQGIYQDFLRDYFPTFNESKCKDYSALNQLTENQSYLFLFQALASVNKDNPIVDVNVLKEAVSLIIEEYLQNSWFISHEKRQAALDLQAHIHGAAGAEDVVSALMDSQLAVAKKDIQINTQRFFFSTNYSGTSRLQNSISRALALATSLGVKTKTDTLVDGLTQLLSDLVPEDIKPELKSLDGLMRFAESPSGKDSANALVLSHCLQEAHGYAITVR